MGPGGHYQLEDGLYEKPRTRSKTCLYSVLVLVLLIGAGVGIGVAVSRLSGDDSSDSSVTSTTNSGATVASGDDGTTSGATVASSDATDGATTPSDATSSDTTSTTSTTTDEEDPAEAPPPAPAAAAAMIPVVAPATNPVPVLAPPPIAPVPAAVPAAAPAVAPAAAPALVEVDIGTGVSNSWTELPDVPHPMGEVGAGVLTFNGNPYYVIAGEHPFGDENNGLTMILDLAEGEWIEGAERPEIGNHHAAEVIDNQLYFFGGLSGGEQTLQIGKLIASASKGVDIEWKLGENLPFASGSAATAYIGGKVYYCGGINAANTQTVDTCAVYNPTTDTWAETVSPMPKGRNHAATCTDGQKMYIFGGRSGKNIVGEGFADTQIYDPATDTWTVGANMTVARGGTGKGVFHAGRCYVFGGEVWEEEEPSVVRKITSTRVSIATDIYTIADDEWGSGKDMSVGLHGMFPVKYGDVVLMASGGTEAAYSQSTHAFAYTL